MPSDHLIPDVAAFTPPATAAARLAADGRIVVLGIAPTGPSTAYGYIARGAALAAGGHALDRFVEKPDAARAADADRRGLPLERRHVLLPRRRRPPRDRARTRRRRSRRCERAIDDGRDDLGALRLGAGFLDAPKISFDVAVMERTARGAVVEADFDWSDIGDWKSVWEQSPRDDDGVAREGRVRARDVSDSYLRSDGRLVCVLGVDGLAIIDTPDALLVAPIERAQEVKGLVAELEADGVARGAHPGAGPPPLGLVSRPWTSATAFRVKRILVQPGKKLSLQRHHHRAEHWIVVRGTAEVTRDGEVLTAARERIDLPAARLRAPPRQPRQDPGRDHRGADRQPTSRRTTSSASRTTSAASDPGPADPCR